MKTKTDKLGLKVDEIYSLDQKIDTAEAAVRRLKEQRGAMESHLLAMLRDQEVDSVKGRRGIAAIKTTRHPNIKNRSKLDKYIRSHDAFDLLQNRVSSKAYFERIEAGERIPGIEVFEKTSLSITKRRA